MLAQEQVITCAQFANELRNAPKVARPVVDRDGEFRQPTLDGYTGSIKCIDLGPFDIHLNVGSAIAVEHVVEAHNLHADVAVIGEDGATTGIIAETQEPLFTMQPRIDRLDPR